MSQFKTSCRDRLKLPLRAAAALESSLLNADDTN